MKITRHHFPILALTTCFVLVGISEAADAFDRTTLPILQPERPLYSETAARNAKPPAGSHVDAPKGAPSEERLPAISST